MLVTHQHRANLLLFKLVGVGVNVNPVKMMIYLSWVIKQKVLVYKFCYNKKTVISELFLIVLHRVCFHLYQVLFLFKPRTVGFIELVSSSARYCLKKNIPE